MSAMLVEVEDEQIFPNKSVRNILAIYPLRLVRQSVGMLLVKSAASTKIAHLF